MNNEILFLLGNGSSIASSNKILLDTVGPLSIPNFIKVIFSLEEPNIRYDAKNKGFNNRDFDYIFGPSDYNTSNLRRLTEKFKTKDICELYNFIKQNEDDLLDNNEIQLLELDDLIVLIYSTVLKYYKKIEKQYYTKLYNIIKRKKSPFISLNWDINFERLIFEETNIKMKHYYSKILYNELSDVEKQDKFNPVVKILKPHGSLNQYFIGSPYCIGTLPETEYHLYIIDSLYRYSGLNFMYLLIPPLREKDIPELDKNYIRNKWDGYNIKKLKILKEIRLEIKRILNDTKTLIIIGYSFPKQDKHIVELFKENKIEKIYVFDKKESVFNQIKSYSYFQKAKFIFLKNGFKDILNFNF